MTTKNKRQTASAITIRDEKVSVVVEWSLNPLTGNVTIHRILNGRDDVSEIVLPEDKISIWQTISKAAKEVPFQERVDMVVTMMNEQNCRNLETA